MTKRRKKMSSGREGVKKELVPEILGGAEGDILDSGAASAGEMTGLIPGGGDLTAEQYGENRDLFPFGTDPLLPR